jgi:hypothetical protein
LLYVFSLASDEMWQDCVLPIVSISDFLHNKRQ